MTEYQIEANTRRCALTGRELKPGDKFYSVLLEEAGKFQRKDYSTEAWQGPPEGAFSFWCGRIAAEDGHRHPSIDDDMLVECFQRLEPETDRGRLNFRYVVALLLMRRKRLRFEEALTRGEDEVLVLRDSRTREQHRVLNPRLTEQQMADVQDEVFRVLGWQ
jgi:hypothetical protein